MKQRILALRDPNSSGVGSWDGAFLFIEQTGRLDVLALFVEDKDFIAHPSYQEAEELYLDYLDKGWQPMPDQDIFETSRVKVTADYVRVFPTRSSSTQRFIGYAIAFSAAYLLVSNVSKIM